MLIALCMLALTGCSNDDIQSVDTTPADIRVSFTTPAGYSGELTMTDVHLTLTEINTGKETAFSFSTAENMTVTLNSVDGGYYRISATGKLNYRNSDLVAKTVEVTAYSDGTTLSKENAVVNLALQVVSQPDHGIRQTSLTRDSYWRKYSVQEQSTHRGATIMLTSIL